MEEEDVDKQRPLKTFARSLLKVMKKTKEFTSINAPRYTLNNSNNNYNNNKNNTTAEV